MHKETSETDLNICRNYQYSRKSRKMQNKNYSSLDSHDAIETHFQLIEYRLKSSGKKILKAR